MRPCTTLVPCERQELNDWLRQVARQHQDTGLSKTFVALRDEAPERIRALREA